MKVRLLALASVAIVSLGSNDAFADNYNVSGFVGVGVGGTWSDYESENHPCLCSPYGHAGDAFVFSGNGSINAWLSKDMSVQLDAQAEGTTSIDQFGSDHPSYTSDGRDNVIIGGHLSWRDPKSHLIGIFGGFSGASNLDWDGTMSHGIVGVEGQYYAGPVTLYGQGGYQPLMSDSDESEPEHVWFLRGVGRYFVDNNDRLQGEFGYANADARGESSSYDIYIWGAGWDHRYTGTPFSTGIQYNGFYNDSSNGNWSQEHVVQVTFAIHFGDDSLMDEDRNGATLDMPNFDRAYAWSYWGGR